MALRDFSNFGVDFFATHKRFPVEKFLKYAELGMSYTHQHYFEGNFFMKEHCSSALAIPLLKLNTPFNYTTHLVDLPNHILHAQLNASSSPGAKSYPSATLISISTVLYYLLRQLQSSLKLTGSAASSHEKFYSLTSTQQRRQAREKGSYYLSGDGGRRGLAGASLT
jgi:hypothetical protein